MELIDFPLHYNRTTGSEAAPSHRGTMCMDQAGDPNGGLAIAYAPTRVTIVKFDATCNSVWFAGEGFGPKYSGPYVIRMAHTNDDTVRLLGLNTLGRTFNKGFQIYRAGTKGTAAAHIHMEIGKGNIAGSGWYQTSTGNWSINTTGGAAHLYDMTYLIKGTPVYRFGNSVEYPQDLYKWLVAPELTQADVRDIANMAIKVGATGIRVRQYATTAAISPQIEMLQNVTAPILGISTVPFDGYNWVKLNYKGVTGYAAYIPSLSEILDLTPATPTIVIESVTETEMYFTWGADRICKVFEYSLDNTNWSAAIDLEVWNHRKIVGLTPGTDYTVYFRVTTPTDVQTTVSVNIKTLVLDPTAVLKEELEIAKATIAAKDATIADINVTVNNLKNEINSFVVVDKPIYEKA